MVDQACHRSSNDASPMQDTIFTDATDAKPVAYYWFVMSVVQQYKFIGLFEFQWFDYQARHLCASMRSPIHRITGTAMLFPRAL